VTLHLPVPLEIPSAGAAADGAGEAELREGLWFSDHSTLAVVAGFSLMSSRKGSKTSSSLGGVHGGAGRCEEVAVPALKDLAGSRRSRLVLRVVSSPSEGGDIEISPRAGFPGCSGESRVYHRAHSQSNYPQTSPSSGVSKT